MNRISLFLLFSLLINICAIVGFFVWQQLKSETRTQTIINSESPINLAVTKSEKEASSQKTFDVFSCLIDLAVETKKYYNTLHSFNNINQCTNLDSFVRNQINNFVFMETKFEHLTKRLIALSEGNLIVKKISTLSYNFSLFCKRYINAIILLKENPNNLEVSVICARNLIEFQTDWDELISLTINFAALCENFLTKKQKVEISERLLANFTQDIKKFLNVQAKEGDQAAYRLLFYDGGWLPIIIYIASGTHYI